MYMHHNIYSISDSLSYFAEEVVWYYQTGRKSAVYSVAGRIDIHIHLAIRYSLYANKTGGEIPQHSNCSTVYELSYAA